MAGRVSLPLLRSQPGTQTRLVMTRKIPVQLPLPYPWGFLRETSNLRFLSPFSLNPSPSQRQTLLLHPLSLTPHPSASPLYPTSPSQILPTTSLPSASRSQIPPRTNLPSIPRPSSPTSLSTSKTAMWKCCVGTHCSAFTPAACPSTLLHFVRCLVKLACHRQNHPTVVLVSRPPTLPQISRRFSR